jgi:heat-inducible transcriptional repressor
VLKRGKMDKRAADILLVIIEEYVNSAEPVGSKNITDKYSLGVSSATVRNEMHQLEEEGYITSIHTSSGRIPTDKGYRFYVDYLTEYIKQKEIEEKIYRLLKRVEIEDALDNIFKKLFPDNPYTSLGVLKRNESRIDTFHILSVAKDTYLLVLILKNRIAAHRLKKNSLAKMLR